MSEKVTQLADRQGIPPKLRNAGEELCDEIWAAIDKATEAGLPVSMMVGFVEMAKSDLLRELAEVVEGEPS